MKILHRIRRAITRAGSSPGPALGAGAAGARMGLEQIEAVEREEFPPEESATDGEEGGESE